MLLIAQSLKSIIKNYLQPSKLSYIHRHRQCKTYDKNQNFCAEFHTVYLFRMRKWQLLRRR